MKPLAYVLSYACLMHYLAIGATKLPGEYQLPLPLFLVLNAVGFVVVVAAIRFERNKS